MSPSELPTAEHVVLLHGFGGTRHGWDRVVERLDRERYLPLALDLPGHGSRAGAAAAITFSLCVETVLAETPSRFVLGGYSLGGRIALHVALAAPARVSRLVLVAASPGIEDPRERSRRRRDDELLARRLETAPFERFIDAWRTQPLFAADPPDVDALARADQRRNRPASLAAVLRGVGAGRMQPLWGRLRELEMPVTVLAGERDRKYVEIGRRMQDAVPRGELLVIGGGHALPLESPAAVAAALEGIDAEAGPARKSDRPAVHRQRVADALEQPQGGEPAGS